MDSPLSWQEEAQAVIKDVKALVKTIEVSDSLQSDSQKIFLNIVTNEDLPFCVELSTLGFRIVGKSHDTTDLVCETYYDTPYSLLSEISQSYTNTFANVLISKLQENLHKDC